MAKQTFTTGDVLTAAAMTSLQQTAMGGGAATAKTTSYTLVAGDAGTTVIMDSASATTITINQNLFAAGDTVNIQNIGAGICTITPGSATVNTAGSLALNQYEGGILYFRSTSASTFFDYVQTGSVSPLTTKGDLYGFSTLDARVPIGTNGHVLTADSTQSLGLKWASVSSAQNFSLLGTGTLTGAATVTVSGISGQNMLMILVKGASSASAASVIGLRLNTDTASNYKQYGIQMQVETSYNAINFAGVDRSQTYFTLGALSANAGDKLWGGATIFGANSAGKKMMQQNAGGGSELLANGQWLDITSGFYDSSSTISSVSLISNTGNFDAGTFEVYGSA